MASEFFLQKTKANLTGLSNESQLMTLISILIKQGTTPAHKEAFRMNDLIEQ